MTYDFLSIGDTQLDTITILNPEEVEVKCEINRTDCLMCLDYASKIPVSQLHQMVAGNAANAAVTGARLDGQTGFWTMLGHDDIADRELKHFEDENIDTTFTQKVPGCQSHQSTVISVSGERTILVYHAPRTYVLPHDLFPAKWVYLTSMAKGSETIFDDLVTYVDTHQAKLAFQPGTYQLRLGAQKAEALLKRTDVVFMNKEEAQLYTGSSSHEVPALIERLLALGPKIVVLTDGTKGSYASDGQSTWFLGTRPEIPRVEVTGAGDAYSSAFAVALMHGQPIPEAMRWGTFNAESVIQKIGPQAGILTRQELHAELARNSDFQAQQVKG